MYMYIYIHIYIYIKRSKLQSYKVRSSLQIHKEKETWINIC